MSKFVVAALIFSLSPAAWADDARQSRVPEVRQTPAPKIDYGTHDACMGDKYESDEDVNFGNAISEEEILLAINPAGA